jgi:hypothetical protein
VPIIAIFDKETKNQVYGFWFILFNNNLWSISPTINNLKEFFKGALWNKLINDKLVSIWNN